MKPIPFTKGFQADADGNIYDPDGDLRPQYTNGDGYKTASVKTDDDKWTTFGVHRLVALAYHQPVIDHLLLTVNHLDGDILNNTPGNLEWITAAKNIMHGIILNRYTSRPLIIAHKKDMEFYFNDLYDISRYLKTDVDTIWNHIRDHTPYNGWVIRHLKASDMKSQMIVTARPRHISDRVRALTMLDLETDKKRDFCSMRAAADHFKVGITNIRHRISTPGYPKVFKGVMSLWIRGNLLTSLRRKWLNEASMERLRRSWPTMSRKKSSKNGSRPTSSYMHIRGIFQRKR